MKKFIFLMIALFTMAVANAQQTNFAGSSKFTDNWSIGLNGGIQTNLHDWNTPNGAVFGLELNKQVTPLFGLTLEANAGVNNRMNWYSGATHFCNGTAFDQVNVLVDGRFNLMNAVWGYKGTPRAFEVETVTGVGYGHGFASSASGYPTTDVLLAKAGLNFNYNFGKQKQWTVKVTPAVLWNVSATGKFDSRFGVAQLTGGIVYHFKSSNQKHHFSLPEPEFIDKITIVEKPVEKVVTVDKIVKVVDDAANVGTCWSVDFKQGSSEIAGDVKALADEINKTNGALKISGFTSPEGSERVNKALGEARAKALKDALVKAGVDAGRISIEQNYETLRTATVRVK